MYCSLLNSLTFISEPLEHALISEEDNETNSEESDDEWNFITVEKFKGKWTSPDDEKKRKNIQENFEPIVRDSSEVQSSEVGDNIKCEAQEKDTIPPLTDEVSIYYRHHRVAIDIRICCLIRILCI